MPTQDGVLVTGGAGFLGSHLVDRLLAEGRRVAVLDSFNESYAPQEKRANLADALARGSVPCFACDVRDAEAMEKAFGAFRPSAVVHMAAMPGVRASVRDPRRCLETNVAGLAQVLEGCHRHEVARVVFASSSSVYGAAAKLPVDETAPTDRPLSPYAVSKRAGELLCETCHRLHGIELATARFFTAYGPRQRPDMAVRTFVERMTAGEPVSLLGDGSSSRDYTYVDDIIDGVVRALDAEHACETFNLGSGRATQLADLVAGLERVLGMRAKVVWQPPSPADPPHTLAAVDKARRLLGYEPRTLLDEGLERFASWWRAHRRS